MNHIYRSIWSDSLLTWIAVPENTGSKVKRSSVKKAVIATSLAAFSSVGFALPTGQQVVAGQVSINTPSATQMNINQNTQKAIVNWNGFSINANEAVNIQQPNVSSILLNRVVGMDASVIQGQLNANGQVYLVNPNGVLFSHSSSVDVGGLIASTHNISNADFLNGNNHFSQDGATGSVNNQGIIKVPTGGTVALIGVQVSNSGTIETPQGSAILAAGKTVDLDFQGAGLVETKIPEAALNAQIENKGAILADGGRVILTAQAASQLASTVINQTGLIQAKSLISRNGEILLDGGSNGTVQSAGVLDTSGQSANGGTIKVLAGMQNGVVNVTGKLDASASGIANGGFIETSAATVNVADDARVSSLAAQGKSGEWLIDPNDFTISATGNMTASAVGTALAGGDFTISTFTQGTTGGNGDIFVNDAVSWSANKLTLNAQRNININADVNATNTATLALEYGQGAVALNNTSTIMTNNGAVVNLPASTTNFTTKLGNDGAVKNYTVITDLGAAGSTTTTDLQGMNGNLAGNYVLGANIDASATSEWNNNAGFKPIGDATTPFSGVFDGLGHTISGLTINRPGENYVGLFGLTETGSNIRNVGLVQSSVTGYESVGGLVGTSESIINNTYATGSVVGTYVIGGLVGGNGGSINNSHSTTTVNGYNVVGGLVGMNKNTITNSYATGAVTGTRQYVGGLVGLNNNGTLNKIGTIDNAYATGAVVGYFSVGGLVGFNFGVGIIRNAYATGAVTGEYAIGGLVGNNYLATINNSYATGAVTGNRQFGGLVGINSSSNIANSFWNTETTGQNIGIGTTQGNITNVVGKTTAQMMQMTSFTSWDIGKVGNAGTTWRIYEGYTTPFLSYWLTPLTVGADNISKTYNGLSDSTLSNTTYTVTGSAPSGQTVLSGHVFDLANPYNDAVNVGTYTPVLYSDQQGNDISLSNGVLTINPADYTQITGTKTYDGNVTFTGVNPATVTGVNGETFAVDTADASDKNVAGTKTFISVGTLTGSSGALTSNYNSLTLANLTGSNNVAIINPAILTYTADEASRILGAANPTFTGTVTGFVSGEQAANATTGTMKFTSPANNLTPVGSYAIDGSGLVANFGNYIFAQANNNATALTVTAPPIVADPSNTTAEETSLENFDLESQIVQLQKSTNHSPFAAFRDSQSRANQGRDDEDSNLPPIEIEDEGIRKPKGVKTNRSELRLFRTHQLSDF